MSGACCVHGHGTCHVLDHQRDSSVLWLGAASAWSEPSWTSNPLLDRAYAFAEQHDRSRLSRTQCHAAI